MIGKTYDVALNGRAVSVSDIDRSDGVTATLAVDGHTVRLDLDVASAREAFAATTGIAAGDIDHLRQWALSLGSPTPAASGQPVALPSVEPFPLHVLPPVVHSYCESAARSLGTDISVEMIAAPMLAMVGALIGKRLGIAAKGSWIESPGLFVAIVAKPGSAKTAAINLARKPIARLQAEARKDFEQQLAAHREDHAAWTRDKGNDDRGAEPVRPKMKHYFTTDSTLERLGELLNENPGVAVVADELRGWLLSFDKYRAGKGNDRQAFLSLWSSDSLKIDRKATASDPLYITNPVASVVGGLQSDFAGDFRLQQGSDGMQERILPIVLSHASQQWTEESVTAKLADDLYALVQQIDSLDPAQYHETTITVHLHPEAYRHWVTFFNANADRVNAATGLAAGMQQKMSNHALRFALILHTLWHPADPRVMVSEETMLSAIALADWWRGHIARYLALIGSVAGDERDDPISRRILRILRMPLATDDAGWVTRTDIYNRLRTVRSEELDGALSFLEAAARIEHRTDVSATKRGTSWRITQHTGSEDSHFSESPYRTSADTSNTPNNQNPQNGAHHDGDPESVIWQAPPPTEPDIDDDAWPGEVDGTSPWTSSEVS